MCLWTSSVWYHIGLEWNEEKLSALITGILTRFCFFSKLGKNKHIWHYLPLGMGLVIWPVVTLVKRRMFSWIIFGKHFDLWNIHQILYKYLLFVIIFLSFFNLILFSSYMYQPLQVYMGVNDLLFPWKYQLRDFIFKII
jgi:hypothetical protein